MEPLPLEPGAGGRPSRARLREASWKKRGGLCKLRLPLAPSRQPRALTCRHVLARLSATSGDPGMCGALRGPPVPFRGVSLFFSLPRPLLSLHAPSISLPWFRWV